LTDFLLTNDVFCSKIGVNQRWFNVGYLWFFFVYGTFWNEHAWM